MEEGSGRELAVLPIYDGSSAKQANVPCLKDQAVKIPEPEDMDAKLPVLTRHETVHNEAEVMEMEILDSEEASEYSSPAKVEGEEGERADSVLPGDDAVQTAEEGLHFEVGDRNSLVGERKVATLEILDSEEASELSSPVKIDMADGTESGAVKPVGIPENIEKRHEQQDQQSDATMMDVSALVQGDGMLGGYRSRATERIEIQMVKMSEAGKEGSRDAKEKIITTLDKDEGSLRSVKDESHIQRALSKEMRYEALLDTATHFGIGKMAKPEQSHTVAARGVPVYQTTPDEENDVKSVVPQAQTDAYGEGPANSSVIISREVSIVTQKLLDDISPTLSDVSDTISKPSLLQTVTPPTILRGDGDEDKHLPDAPDTDEDSQLPTANATSALEELTRAPTLSMASSDGASKTIETQSSRPKHGVAEKPHTIEKVAASRVEASSDPKAQVSNRAIAAPPEPESNRRLKKYATSPNTSIEQFTQGAEQNPDAETSVSLTKLVTSSPVSGKGAFQQSTAQELTQQNEEASQTNEIPSSPPQLASESFFGGKRNQTPSASFPTSESSQNKDVLMAELKAIKIASIQARITSLKAEIASKRVKLEEVTKDLTQPAAETVKRHIKLLHDYNDIKDVGQGLVGMIADSRGVRIGELYEEFGVGLKD